MRATEIDHARDPRDRNRLTFRDGLVRGGTRRADHGSCTLAHPQSLRAGGSSKRGRPASGAMPIPASAAVPAVAASPGAALAAAAPPAPPPPANGTLPGKKHATRRSERPAPAAGASGRPRAGGSSSGRSTAQRGCATGQRGGKGHPDGGADGLGGSPASGARTRNPGLRPGALVAGQATGTEASRLAV